MAHEQDSADRRIESATLVLGLAGTAALWLLFASGKSPIAAWRLLSSQAAYTFTSRALGPISAVWLAGLLSFFLAPLVSLAQWSRCLGRPCSVRERGVQTAAVDVFVRPQAGRPRSVPRGNVSADEQVLRGVGDLVVD